MTSKKAYGSTVMAISAAHRQRSWKAAQREKGRGMWGLASQQGLAPPTQTWTSLCSTPRVESSRPSISSAAAWEQPVAAGLAVPYQYNHTGPSAGDAVRRFRDSCSLATRGYCEMVRRASCGQIQELPATEISMRLRRVS